MNEASAKQKAALWVAAVFLLGAALGGMLGYVFARQSYAAHPMRSVQPTRAQRVEQLSRELDLTDAQKQQVDAILDDMFGQFKAIQKQYEPQRDEARHKGRDRIRAILTPEQKTKFEEFLKRLDQERKQSSQ
jgi:Spy/CpxP family protein refolding chaperone